MNDTLSEKPHQPHGAAFSFFFGGRLGGECGRLAGRSGRLTCTEGTSAPIMSYLYIKLKYSKTMRQLLLIVTLFASLSATAARPTVEEMLAENNFQIVDDHYQERPIWIKTYHCDSATIVSTLMNNPQIVIEREFEGRWICRMNDVQLVRFDEMNILPAYMRWAGTFYFTVAISADSYEVELREAVWSGVQEPFDDVKTVAYTLYYSMYNRRGEIDGGFVRNYAEKLNERLTWLFAPRVR